MLGSFLFFLSLVKLEIGFAGRIKLSPALELRVPREPIVVRLVEEQSDRSQIMSPCVNRVRSLTFR